MTNIISTRLKEAMRLRNIGQAEISAKSNIPKSSISYYLSGKYEPKQTNIYKMAKVLDVNPVWLMGLNAPMIEDENFKFGTEIEQILIKICDEFNITLEDAKNIFLNNNIVINESENVLNYDNIYKFFLNYFKIQKYNQLLKEKGLMDEDDNIDEEKFDKVMKIADIMDFKKKE